MSGFTRILRPLLVVACGASALLLSACGSTSPPTASAPTASATPSPSPSPVGVAGTNLGVATQTVQIPSLRFDPSDLTVAAGSIVQWNQADETLKHNVTFTTAGGPSPLSSSTMPFGGVWQVKFTVAGVYHYICSLHHTEMKGTVTVTG
jgi:plastocyanin